MYILKRMHIINHYSFIVYCQVIVCHCKFHQSYKRFTTRHHQLIPIFGFGRGRSKSHLSNTRHWLSGKGNMQSFNKSSSAANSPQQSGPNSGTGLHNYHQPGLNQQPRGHFNRHLAMNLENDMYYTVDFSESQHSPLIQ